ncbi:MAG: NAD(P)-binding domain-containing protein [Polyangiales bacterium]
MKPVAIVGAGPAGLAVAAALAARRVSYVLIDSAGEPGGAYRMVHDDMTLVSPTEMSGLPGLSFETRGRYPTGHEVRAYLVRYAAHHRLVIDRAEVGNITRGLEITTDRGPISARAVVVASGMWRFPELPDIPGLPAATIHSSQYRGPTAERTLIIGGGASAVEIAEEIARTGAAVTMSTRRPIRCAPAHVLGLDLHHLISPLERVLPTWLAPRHCAGTVTLPPTDHGFGRLRAAKLIELRPPVVRFDDGTAHFADGSTGIAERVIAATGFTFRTPFLPGDVARATGGHLRARRGRSVSWPNLHVVGHPCSVDLASQFLRGIARDAHLVAEDLARA